MKLATWLRTVSQIAWPQLLWRARYQWERRRPVVGTRWQFPGDGAPAVRRDFPEMPAPHLETNVDELRFGKFHHLNETRDLRRPAPSPPGPPGGEGRGEGGGEPREKSESSRGILSPSPPSPRPRSTGGEGGGAATIDWLLGPVREGRLWAVTLHYHEWAFALADRGDVDLFEHHVSSWITDCSLETPGARDLAWNAYAIATRITWWIRSYRRLGGFADRPAFARTFLRSLWQQAAYLFDHLEWDLRANHLLRDLVGLAWAGRFFDEPASRRWLQTAASLAAAQAAEQVLPDGGHFERSPMYHHHAMADFRDLATLTGADLGETLARMGEFAAWMQHPDGDIPLFNDAALGSATGLVRTNPPQGLGMFPGTGMYVWHGPRLSVFFDVGEVGPRVQPGHAHADTLSVEISFDGRRLFVDPGTHSYDNDARRRYDRSTAAHNTVCVDGADSSEVWHIFRVGRRARPEIREVAVLGMDVRAGHTGYDHLPGRPQHERQVNASNEVITIRDQVTGLGSHVVEGGFLVDPGWTVTPDETGWILSQDDAKVRVRCVGPAEMSRSVASRPYHPRFGVEVMTPRLCWRYEGELPVEVETVIESMVGGTP